MDVQDLSGGVEAFPGKDSPRVQFHDQLLVSCHLWGWLRLLVLISHGANLMLLKLANFLLILTAFEIWFKLWKLNLIGLPFLEA